MDQQNLQETIEQLSAQMIARLDGLQHLSEQEYDEDRQIVIEFNKIAAGMLQQEPGIEMPDATQPIPMDDKMVVQALFLFAEGIYFALAKCAETGIVSDLKKSLLQNLAMEVYSQSKQVVAATYGQEHTPEFQFTHEQQVEIINKATEGHLVAFITEYEQVNGPIQPALPPEAAVPEQAIQEEQAPREAKKKRTPAPQPAAKTSGPTPHDKYGAVALLLTTLPDKQRARILKSFNAEEKELIKYYSDPVNLEQNLDLASVEAHLKQFKALLQQGGAAAKNPAFKGIAQLTKHNSPEKLLSCVKDERPLVKRYLQAHYSDEPLHATHRKAGGLPGSQTEQHGSTLLPPRIEEILYRYLSKRLTPA